MLHGSGFHFSISRISAFRGTSLDAFTNGIHGKKALRKEMVYAYIFRTAVNRFSVSEVVFYHLMWEMEDESRDWGLSGKMISVTNGDNPETMSAEGKGREEEFFEDRLARFFSRNMYLDPSQQNPLYPLSACLKKILFKTGR